MNPALDTVVVRPRHRPDATRTLVCLGFCGGGAGPYLGWADVVPSDVTLAAICYPGREGRFAEEFAGDWDELAEDATAAVLAAADRPYVLFGHSMGGWMAFDVVSRLHRHGDRLPEALVVSSANAPSDGLRPRDMFPSQGETDERLLHWMRVNGLLPAHVLDDPDLREMAVELMRADIRVRDSFHYRAGARVGVPLQVFTGADDGVIEPEATERWRELATNGFRHDTLPGGHFYTPDVWGRLPEFMAPINAGFPVA
ncbi:alpha/beta fold hydrolase [Streptosporangium sp. NPDC051023]|uniref:thioesterase II family protein n=1 Tax=Streptosporangium sp. NPDC051023 TaxID=3155410 RepID=UPI00344EFD6B